MRDSQRSVTPENPPWAQWALESSPIMTPEAQIHMRGSNKMFPALARYLCRSRRQHGFLVLDARHTIRE